MPYKCAHCDEQLLSLDELEVHEKSHFLLSIAVKSVSDDDDPTDTGADGRTRVISDQGSDYDRNAGASKDDNVDGDVGRSDDREPCVDYTSPTNAVPTQSDGVNTKKKRKATAPRKLDKKVRDNGTKRPRKARNKRRVKDPVFDALIIDDESEPEQEMESDSNFFPPTIIKNFSCRTEFSCNHCTLVCTSVSECKQHLKICPPKPKVAKPEEAPISKSKAKRVRNLARLEERKAIYNLAIGVDGDKFFCKICDKVFDCESRVARHLDGSGPEHAPSRLLCEFCGAEFKGAGRKHKYETHMRIHTGEKPFLCDECGSSFRLQKNLQKHHRSIHLKEYPFTCSSCGRGFPTSWNLRRHERTHSDDRPERALKQFRQAQPSVSGALTQVPHNNSAEKQACMEDRARMLERTQLLERSQLMDRPQLAAPPHHHAYFPLAQHPLSLVQRPDGDVRPPFSLTYY